MLIDFSKAILALNGKERRRVEKVRENDEEKEVEVIVTLGDVCVQALDFMTDDDVRKLESKEKYRRGELARRIYGAKEPIHVKAEEISLIKDLIAKSWKSAVIISQIHDMLDPSPENVAVEKKDPDLKIPREKKE